MCQVYKPTTFQKLRSLQSVAKGSHHSEKLAPYPRGDCPTTRNRDVDLILVLLLPVAGLSRAGANCHESVVTGKRSFSIIISYF